MFNKIKKLFIKSSETKWFWQYDYDIWWFNFLKNINNTNKKISKTELLNLFTGYSYVCITAISEWVASLDRKLFFSENRIDREKNHKYMDFITNSFLEEVVWFLEITWICYIKINKFWNTIDNLEVLRPDLVYENTDWSFNYNLNWDIKNIKKEDIFIIKNFSPFKNWLWFSPLEALWKQQKMDDAIIEWNWNFFENGASTGTTLQTDQNLSIEQKEYLAQKWKNEFMWKWNAHKIAVLDNWLKEQKWEIWQKDMDFVNQRTQIRDEIFTIFRVPKVVVWITDWVWYTDRLVWKTNFAEFKLKPIAQKIEEALNKYIFKWIWFFKFINIIPVDVEQLARDYQIWAITLDEYRIKRNYLNVKNWNKNISWEIFEYENNWNYLGKKENTIEKILEKTVKDFTNKKGFWEEVLQKRWQEKIKRTDKYENDFEKILKEIFLLQEKEILKNLQKIFYKKKLEDLEKIEEKDLFSEVWFLIIFQKYFYNYYKNIFKKESKIANDEIWDIDLNFEKIEKYIWELIKKFAIEINKNTKKEILEIIKNTYKEWSWYDEIVKNIKNKFEDFWKTRAKKIARTEITRAVNKARVETRKQSQKVTYKKWFTALDERTCPHCRAMHWKKTYIWEDFYKVWDKTQTGLAIDYENIWWAPLHVMCRCDLVPVLEYLEN